MKFSNNHKPLPFAYYFSPVLAFIIIGLASAVYLFIIHYKNYTDITFSSICALSKAINCDTVAQSKYSVFLSVPLAVWGIINFIFYFLLAVRAAYQKDRHLWILIFIISLSSSLVSIYLGYLSAIKIHSYCIFCLTCYLCHFGIAFYSFIIIRRFNIIFSFKTFKNSIISLVSTPRSKMTTCSILIIILLLPILFPNYWDMAQSIPLSQNIKSGITSEGNPWIGAESPDLSISIFSDYQCFQCYKMHSLLMTLIRQYPDKIRLVHIHFPLDHNYNPAVVHEDFHIGSGELALIGILASNEGKFWDINHKLFTLGRNKGVINLKKLAEEYHLDQKKLLQLRNDIQLISQLRKDMKKGIDLKINSTPSFEINGNIYRGTIPVELLTRYTIQ